MARSKRPEDETVDSGDEIEFTPSAGLLRETTTSGEPATGIHPDSSPAAQGTQAPEPGIDQNADVALVDTRPDQAHPTADQLAAPGAGATLDQPGVTPSPELAPSQRGQTDPNASPTPPMTEESRPLEEQDRPNPDEILPGAEVPEDERWVRVQAGPNLIHVFEKLYDGTLRHHRTETGTL